MTCIRTGCDVYLASHGGVLHGDMFKVGDVYILHHCGMHTMRFGPCRESECDYAFNDIGPVYDGDCMYLDSAQVIAMKGYLVDEHDR